jgi:squalene-associated FAD-dependent desaturase
MARTYVIGAGLSGLAAAVKLAERGIDVTLCEGAGQAGGRCRSFYDDVLGCLIDNGNHLLLSGNTSAMSYLALIGAQNTIAGPAKAVFPFLDLETGERWTVEPGKSPVPLWIFDAQRRVPGTKPAQYGASLKLFLASRKATVEAALGGTGALYRRFWEPLAVAVLNTPADRAAARLLIPVLLETFARGEAACRPRIVRDGLSESLVAPALAYLARHHATLRFGERLVGIDSAGGRVTALRFAKGTQALETGDAVVLALPPAGAAAMLPGLPVPTESFPIVNVHYRLSQPVNAGAEPSLLGLVGGVAHWLFIRGRIVSVTISAAEPLVQEPAEAIAEKVWHDVARALRLSEPLPPHRVVKERRATFAQTPSALAQRPPSRTALANLALAGDWTDTGLPATIEGAIRSGFKAAQLIASRWGSEGAGVRAPAMGQDTRLTLGVG